MQAQAQTAPILSYRGKVWLASLGLCIGVWVGVVYLGAKVLPLVIHNIFG
jgi:hypothetical protein